MGRYLVWALALAAWTVLSATPAAAQVGVGVWTPNGGAGVVLGAPPVYYPPPVYAYPPPVYVVPGAHYYGFYRPFPVRPGWAYGPMRYQARFPRPSYYGYPSYYYRSPRYYGYTPYAGRAYRTYGYAGPVLRGDYRGGGRYRRR
jgi:hypothetical protein